MTTHRDHVMETIELLVITTPTGRTVRRGVIRTREQVSGLQGRSHGDRNHGVEGWDQGGVQLHGRSRYHGVGSWDQDKVRESDYAREA